MDWFWSWFAGTGFGRWLLEWFRVLPMYYGCPNSKKAEILQMKRSLYK
jgi:hypothetical protein